MRSYDWICPLDPSLHLAAFKFDSYNNLPSSVPTIVAIIPRYVKLNIKRKYKIKISTSLRIPTWSLVVKRPTVGGIYLNPCNSGEYFGSIHDSRVRSEALCLIVTLN